MASRELNKALEDIVGVVDKIDEALTHIAQVQARAGLRRNPLHDAVELLYKAKREAEDVWNNLEIEAGIEERPESPGQPQFRAVPVTYPTSPHLPTVHPISPVRPASPPRLPTIRPASPRGDLEAMTVAQLRDMAKNRGLRGYSGKTKAELIELIRETITQRKG